MDATPSRPAGAATRPMFREQGRAFLAVPRAVPACRMIIRAGLFAHGLADLADNACAVATELATNAVSAMQIERQSGRLGGLPPFVVLSLEWMTSGVRIGLWDDSPGIPSIRAPARGAETVDGLVVVDSLTAGRWGWFGAGTGKCVWAEISRPTPQPRTGRPRTGRRSRDGGPGTRRT